MNTQLRDMLLKWYFERGGDRTSIQPPLPTPVSPAPIPVPQGELPGFDENRRRVTFLELAKFGLIQPGEEIFCRSLKRQQRRGAEPFIRGAKVAADGRVDFQGNKFSSPSKLAREMVNAHGGRAEALNGYDYLFLQSSNGLVALEDLRERLLGRKPDINPADETMAEILVQEGHFSNKKEALEWHLDNKPKV